MPMLKYAGLAVILAVCLLTGFDAAAAVRRKVAVTASLLRLLRHIGSSIEYSSPPLGTIYASFADETLERYGFCDKLRSDGLDGALECIKDTVGAEITALIHEFGSGLGKCGREGQISHCSHYTARLNEIYEAVSDDAPKKMKIYTSLGITAALTMALIFI